MKANGGAHLVSETPLKDHALATRQAKPRHHLDEALLRNVSISSPKVHVETKAYTWELCRNAQFSSLSLSIVLLGNASVLFQVTRRTGWETPRRRVLTIGKSCTHHVHFFNHLAREGSVVTATPRARSGWTSSRARAVRRRGT